MNFIAQAYEVMMNQLLLSFTYRVKYNRKGHCRAVTIRTTNRNTINTYSAFLNTFKSLTFCVGPVATATRCNIRCLTSWNEKRRAYMSLILKGFIFSNKLSTSGMNQFDDLYL
ncbi:hypothetical protein GJ496_007017 [Pomphorhynchus laevis]|nr:hypothetical protein GJ496_007017 [Pomphorhynchus laevis]